jgi:sarcosine oxidase subunit alpha
MRNRGRTVTCWRIWSGLAATLTAARAGLRVILAEDQAEFGGGLLSEITAVNSAGADRSITLAFGSVDLRRTASVTPVDRRVNGF